MLSNKLFICFYFFVYFFACFLEFQIWSFEFLPSLHFHVYFICYHHCLYSPIYPKNNISDYLEWIIELHHLNICHHHLWLPSEEQHIYGTLRSGHCLEAHIAFVFRPQKMSGLTKAFWVMIAYPQFLFYSIHPGMFPLGGGNSTFQVGSCCQLQARWAAAFSNWLKTVKLSSGFFWFYVKVESFITRLYLLMCMPSIMADGVAVLLSAQRKGERLSEVQCVSESDWR